MRGLNTEEVGDCKPVLTKDWLDAPLQNLEKVHKEESSFQLRRLPTSCDCFLFNAQKTTQITSRVYFFVLIGMIYTVDSVSEIDISLIFLLYISTILLPT